jgi:hypothetical protein
MSLIPLLHYPLQVEVEACPLISSQLSFIANKTASRKPAAILQPS